MSSKRVFNNLSELCHYLGSIDNIYIVVCGFDNVGKGTVIDKLSTLMRRDKKLPVFHPDYSLICEQVSASGRWSYFMYFLDILNTFKNEVSVNCPLIFDRSALCGSVYNNNHRIAVEYANRISDLPIIHILVTCDEDSYNKFVGVRDNEAKFTYNDYLVYTERYRCYMDVLDIPYVEFFNKYDYDLGEYLTKVCGGCGHFKTDKCINPKGFKDAHYDHVRCQHSSDKEVQDLT